jgi:hypothetical protein
MVNEDLFHIGSNKLAQLREEVGLTGSSYLAHMTLHHHTQTLYLFLSLYEQDRIPVKFELILKPTLDQEFQQTFQNVLYVRLTGRGKLRLKRDHSAEHSLEEEDLCFGPDRQLSLNRLENATHVPVKD